MIVLSRCIAEAPHMVRERKISSIWNELYNIDMQIGNSFNREPEVITPSLECGLGEAMACECQTHGQGRGKI